MFQARPFLCISLLLSSITAFSASITGSLFDYTTKEQLVGAVFTLKGTGKGTTSGLDGSYAIYNLLPGKYNVVISYLGYDQIDTTLSITDSSQVLKCNFFMHSSAHSLHEVTIMSNSGGTDAYANRAEQKSISLVNIVSANAIQISPAITVANVMQRISGVIMDRGSNGDAQYPIIRGMDKRYNTTLVNGIKIPSPNDKDRYVPLDIFPAELLERLEVIKSLLPSMEGDGTGGVVNMVMKNAPATRMLEANLGTGYSSIFLNRDFQKYDMGAVPKQSPAEKYGPSYYASVNDFSYNSFLTQNLHTPVNSLGNLTMGNRYFNRKFGVILSGSFQNIFKGTNSNSFQQVATVQPSAPNEPLVQPVSDYIVRRYSYHIERLGTEAKLDYAVNDKNAISLFATYLQLNEYRVRITDDSTLGGYSRTNGLIGYNAYHRDIQTMQTLQNIFNTTLQGKHTLSSSLTTDWTLALSQAGKKLPDIADYSTDNGVKYDRTTDGLTLGPTQVGNQTHAWMHNSDKTISGYLNLHYQPTFIPTLKKIDFGGLYRTRYRDNYYNRYKMNPVSDSSSTYEQFVSIPATKYYFITNAGYGNAKQNAGTYTFTENISAYYVQLHDEVGTRLKLDGGVRMENTYQEYNSSLPVSQAGKSARYSYSDLLPSLMMKYELTEKSALRASYFRSVNRPAFADLIPFLDPTANENYGSIGNDTLQRSLITNLDVRYEMFPKGLDQLLVGLFYKHLQDPIEYGLYQGSLSADLALIPTNNSSPANNYGVELVYRRYFGAIGFALNYTYTKSVVNASYRLYIYDSTRSSNKTYYSSTKVSRPLQGQADHIGNISLLYKGRNNGVNGQIAFNYTGKSINTISAFAGLDTWQKPTFSLDISAQKKFGRKFTAYIKANNLLNTGTALFIKQNNTSYEGQSKLAYQESASYFILQRNLYHSSYLVGLRYKL